MSGQPQSEQIDDQSLGKTDVAPAIRPAIPTPAQAGKRHAGDARKGAARTAADKSALPFLTAEDNEKVLEHATRAVHAKGDLIIAQGSRQQALYIVREGLVRVERKFLDRSVVVAHLGPGDTFGEMSFLEGVAASATVVAEDEVRLDVVKSNVLQSILSAVPELGTRFYQSIATILSKRLRDTSALIPPLMIEDVPQVNRFHGMRTGYLTHDELPEDLVDVVEDFKTIMLHTDRELKNHRIGDEEASERIGSACSSVSSALRHHVERAPDAAKGIGAYVFRETFSYFMLSRFLDRAFAKPRGYAGDYATMEMLYNNRPQGDGRLGPHVDAWALSTSMAQGVRSRRSFLHRLIQDTVGEWSELGAMPITSLPCGPARELFDVLTEDDAPNLEVLCIDIDLEALHYASEQAVRAGIAERMTFAQDNLVRLSQGRGHIRVAPQQLIYSFGLIDYLRDDLVVSFLDWIHGSLRSNGRFIVGSFDVTNPHKTFLDHIVEWEMIHRSADDLAALFARSKFAGAPLQIEADGSGVQLFAIAIKRSAR